MDNQEKNCYLDINDKKYGPVSEQEIQDLYAQKKITSDTNFIKTGMKEWIPLLKSGVITPDIPVEANDELLLSSKKSKPAKKSKLGVIAATLGVVVVAAVAVAIFIIANIKTMENIQYAVNEFIGNYKTHLNESVKKTVDTMVKNFDYIGAEINKYDLSVISERALLVGSDIGKPEIDGNTATVSVVFYSWSTIWVTKLLQ